MTLCLRPVLMLPAIALLSGIGGALIQQLTGAATDATAAATAIRPVPSFQALPLVLAAGWAMAVAGLALWWTKRDRLAWEHTLAQWTAQARALREGQFEFVDGPTPAWADALTRAMNEMVLRMRGIFEAQERPSETLRRQAQPDPVTGLDNRTVFTQYLSDRLSDPAKPDCALLVIRLKLTDAAHAGPGSDLLPRVLAAMSDMLANYPTRVPGAHVGRLSTTDFALSLPAHGLAAETATSLLVAWRAGPASQLAGLSCVVGAVDKLGGQPVSLALATVEQALMEAQARGPFSMQVCAARAGDDGDPWSGRLGILRALDEGRVRMAEFPVLDAQRQLLHLECPMRLRRDPAGPWESADCWLSMAARHRLMAQVDMKAVQLTLRAITADGVPRCAHVSSQSLSTAGFVSAIDEMLVAEAQAARQLWIEIAEVSFESLPPRLRSACTTWRRSGVKLGIEHAGTGLRNLVGIQDLGLDYVKVASTFACGAAADESQHSRARGMVALVHSLGALVIAEGVDRDEDLSVLWSMGFDGITGPAVTLLAPAAATDRQAMSPM